MRNFKTIAVGLCAITLVSSCQTNQGTGSLLGAGGGAVLGGIVGNIIGKNSKGTLIGAAIGAAVGTGAGTLIGRHMDKVKREADEKLKNATVEKVKDANGLDCVKVTFNSGILFPINKATLSATSKQELTDFAKVLINNNDCDVAIQGYTDASGNDNINLPLSENRAKAVSNFLLQQGVSNSQIRTVEGLGSSNPIENKKVSEANRRVEVYLYASSDMIKKANAGTLK